MPVLSAANCFHIARAFLLFRRPAIGVPWHLFKDAVMFAIIVSDPPQSEADLLAHIKYPILGLAALLAPDLAHIANGSSYLYGIEVRFLVLASCISIR
jgi:hypothetical protein